MAFDRGAWCERLSAADKKVREGLVDYRSVMQEYDEAYGEALSVSLYALAGIMPLVLNRLRECLAAEAGVSFGKVEHNSAYE